MNDFPDDVEEAAHSLFMEMWKNGGGAKLAIAKGIMAERERCAKIAEGMSAVSHPFGRRIASAIRDAA